MPPQSADRNLLFGLLALQNNFIDRDALLDGFNRWVHDKGQLLGEILVERGALAADEFALLDALVGKHLEKFDNDPERSLAALSSIGSVRQDLSRIADPEIQASLGHVSAARRGREDDAARTFAPTVVGGSTSAGTRFLILRPHAKGGLGQVFVARDTELNRDVALKEIQDQFAFEPRFRSRFEFEAEVTGGLEHPGIVPVYGLGHLPDGRPFYAMRFIKGNNLKDAIARFHDAEKKPGRNQGLSTLELRELLGRFIDVCDAIAYAHSRGVLHRDLKPGNIMLDKYGETLVVDWGLAKAVDQSEPESPVERAEQPLKPTSGSALEGTVAGSAIGTPAYMSPEQAEGRMDLLGPRSDVYCLGATLYHLLTGHAPCEAEQAADVLHEVVSGEVPRPRSINPRLARTLEAICVKAMAPQPGDRYESVQALKSDLERWLADEPVTAYREPWRERLQRWGRKHQTLVTSAAAVLFMAACAAALVAAQRSAYARDIEHKNFDLATANRALDAEHKKAVERETLAIDAVKRFQEAVTGEPRLKNDPALQDLRKRLLKEPLAFFRSLRERLQADNDTRTESLARLAEASFALADLTHQIGDKLDALIAVRESLELRQKLADANPSVSAFQRDLARSYTGIGTLLRETGKPTDALESHKAALAIWTKLADANPSVSEFQSYLASSHTQIGAALGEIGKLADALKSHEAALAIRKKLADANPTVSDFQSDLATGYNNIGFMLKGNGKLADALKSLEAALAIQQKLADANPSVSRFHSELALSHWNIGDLLSATGKPADALKSHEAALAIRTKLADANPSITEFQRDLAASHVNIGVLLRDTGRPADALKSHKAALAIWTKLADANPSDTDFQYALAFSHGHVGFLLNLSGKPADALKYYEAAAPILTKLADGNPSVIVFQSQLAMNHHLIGMLLVGARKPADALKSNEAALAIRTKLADANPSVTEFQRDLAASHCNIGIVLSETGKPADALKSFQAALAILAKLVREHPESPDFAGELGRVHHYVALIEMNAKRFTEARDGLRQALECQRKALASNPASPQFRLAVAGHLKMLIEATRALGDLKSLAEPERQLLEVRETDPAMAAVDARLRAIVKGEEGPKDVAERLQFAQRAHETARFAAAARFWQEAFELNPRLADDLQMLHRYNAACAAARAGCGQGKDDPPPSDDQKTKLRRQALEWLTADLGAWAKLLATASNQYRAGVVKMLEHCQRDIDLAGIHDDAELAKLPEAERMAFRKLWADVDALLKKASQL
jgi:serine/threonine-protein kinase